MEKTSSNIRVVCYVRKSSLVAPVDKTLQVLDRLEADGVINEFTVGAWPAEVRLEDSCPHSDVVELFEEFDAWADQWNVSIRPPFAVETRISEITGETRDVLLTPVQCLAIYVNSVLMEVFPHSVNRASDDKTYTVADALTLLEERDTHAFGAGQLSDTSPSHRTAAAKATPDIDMCPACETRLVTGQGVYACPNCDWVGTTTHKQTPFTSNEDASALDLQR